MSKQRRCAFIQSRACSIEADEIPLDVCRLCIDAWKTSAEIQALTGARASPQTITVHGQDEYTQRFTEPETPEPTQPRFELPKLSADELDKESYTQLSELDSRFIKDKIDADEYVRQRRAIVGHLSNVKKVDAPSFGFTSIDLDDIDEETGPGLDSYRKLLPLILIEKKQTGYSLNRYPSGSKLPKSLDDNKIKSIYSLYESLGEDRILIQFNDTRIGFLGRKKNQILCMVLDAEEKLEDHEEEIRYLNDLFQQTDGLDDLVKVLAQGMKKSKTFSQVYT